MAESAVQFFAPDHPQLARTLAGKLRKHSSEIAAEIASGVSGDWADYKWRIGFLAGLNEAIRTCERTEQEFNR